MQERFCPADVNGAAKSLDFPGCPELTVSVEAGLCDSLVSSWTFSLARQFMPRGLTKICNETSTMFEWFEKELRSIRTRRFHLVDGPAAPALRDAIQSSELAVPPSYKGFALKFGNARLYRKGSLYLVQIWAAPRESLTGEGEKILEFGRTDISIVYFKVALLRFGDESPVFELKNCYPEQKVADGFEAWLAQACQSARRMFKKKEWEKILTGPPPFSPQEMAIVAARRKFVWRLAGIAPNGDLLFEVHNGSTIHLPYLTIGIRGTNGQVDGGAWLPTGSIPPGETRFIQKACYKTLLAPSEVEALELPDPEPENRDRYWEFKKVNQTNGTAMASPHQSGMGQAGG